MLLLRRDFNVELLPTLTDKHGWQNCALMRDELEFWLEKRMQKNLMRAADLKKAIISFFTLR